MTHQKTWPGTAIIAIPKMLRFEVFKRDGFACQYFCGVCRNKVREAA